jgi:hypothetical protein
MSVLDLSPYIIDPYGLQYAWATRKRLRLSGFARPYIPPSRRGKSHG